jgi:DNA-binding transcriptional MerR regulator
VSEIPQKQYYKIHELCQYTDTQPYVIRFWESEFPQLAPDRSSSGQPIYRRQDIDLVLRIKQLLEQEDYTIEGVRKMLDKERQGGRRRQAKSAPSARAGSDDTASRASGSTETVAADPASETREPTSPSPVARSSLVFDSVPRQRYDDAVDEIATLRLAVKEAENRARKLEAAAQKAEEKALACSDRADRAASMLEKLIDRLS